MDYIEVEIQYPGSTDPDILVALLADLDFESFSESEGALQGYIREELYRQAEVEECLRRMKEDYGVRYALRKIPSQNWNRVWESAYEPVVVAGKCRVRAPFHEPDPGMDYEIVIEPKMSFGTAHHETTSLMLEMLMEEDPAGMKILDMGCGTGVLSILAHLMGASEVAAVDNDEWAYENALENVARNNAATVTVIRGDAGSIPRAEYDMVIANINRNVLISDMASYAAVLKPGGILLMSGFYEDDLGLIREAAGKQSVRYVNHKSANRWVGARFVK